MYVKKFLFQNETPGDLGSAGSPPPAPAPEASGPATPSEPAGLDIDKASDEIGADLFGSKEPAKEEAPGPSPAPSPEPTAAPVASPAPSFAPTSGPPAADITKAPNTWKPDAAAQWATLPEPIRAEIHRREVDMWKGIEQYKGDAGIGRTVKAAIAPMLPMLQAANMPPENFVKNMTTIHQTLSDRNLTDGQRAAFALDLLGKYGIKLTGDPAEGDEGYVDPQVKGLQEQLRQVESRISAQDQRRQEETVAGIAAEIDKFAKDPANVHFEVVADDIAILIKGSGGTMSLKDAYERAVRANPVTWAREVARIQTEAGAKAIKEAKERADAARKATGANVKASGHSGGGTAAPGSMDDTMADTLRSIRERERQS